MEIYLLGTPAERAVFPYFIKFIFPSIGMRWRNCCLISSAVKRLSKQQTKQIHHENDILH